MVDPYSQEKLDELNFRSDGALQKVFGPDEQILLSTVLYKYNKNNKRQERSILVTSKAIYNVNKQDFFANIISIFNSSYKIRRRIDITHLSGITVSEMSSEFILHISKEYDYRYASPEKRDVILLMICRAYYQNAKNSPLMFAFTDEINLSKFTTTKEDKKNGIDKKPTENLLALTEEKLRKRFEEKNQKKEKLKERTETVYTRNKNVQKVTLDDFDIIKVLGRGAFGKVMLVEKKNTKQVYAMKSLHKEQIIGQDQIEHTKTERYVLEMSQSPFLVGLEFAFQTPEKIFFIMKFMKGGELFHHLRVCRRFDEKRAKFYAAEILLGLEHLHNLGVVYRDLKPENVLMDEDGHVCLTDFGMAKPLKEGELTKSFVGTPEYLAPEVIEGKGHSMPVDWWALGILIYEMMIGSPPFYQRDRSTQEMFTAILKNDVDFGTKVKLTTDAKDLIEKLLTKKPVFRLGTNGADEIKAHRWFNEIDWKALAEKKMTPPFKPRISNDYDVENFDEEFTSEEAVNSVLPDANMNLVNRYQKEFTDFTYVPQNEMLNNKK